MPNGKNSTLSAKKHAPKHENSPEQPKKPHGSDCASSGEQAEPLLEKQLEQFELLLDGVPEKPHGKHDTRSNIIDDTTTTSRDIGSDR